MTDFLSSFFFFILLWLRKIFNFSENNDNHLETNNIPSQVQNLPRENMSTCVSIPTNTSDTTPFVPKNDLSQAEKPGAAAIDIFLSNDSNNLTASSTAPTTTADTATETTPTSSSSANNVVTPSPLSAEANSAAVPLEQNEIGISMSESKKTDEQQEVSSSSTNNGGDPSQQEETQEVEKTEEENMLITNNSSTINTTTTTTNTGTDIQNNESLSSFKVISYNIGYENENQQRKDKPWRERKHAIASLLLKHKPDIIGIQEVSLDQIKELVEMLNKDNKDSQVPSQDGTNPLPKFNWYGLGSNYYGPPRMKTFYFTREEEEEDNAEEEMEEINGEYSAEEYSGHFAPILYNSNRFEMKQKGTFWCSANPGHHGCKGWDACSPRICTWCLLEDVTTKQNVWVFNTQLDQAKFARKNSCMLLRQAIDKYIQDFDDDIGEFRNACIVTGDLNCLPKSYTMRLLTTGQALPKKSHKESNVSSDQQQDRATDEEDDVEEEEEEEEEEEDEILKLQSANQKQDTTPTLTESVPKPVVVDYILFVPGRLQSHSYHVITENHPIHGQQPSHHRPVMSQFSFSNTS